jgi:hypothetical protein
MVAARHLPAAFGADALRPLQNRPCPSDARTFFALTAAHRSGIIPSDNKKTSLIFWHKPRFEGDVFIREETSNDQQDS